MPQAVEKALDKASHTQSGMRAVRNMKKKHGYKTLGEARKAFKYATMTNMQKRGEIPAWRKLKR